MITSLFKGFKGIKACTLTSLLARLPPSSCTLEGVLIEFLTLLIVTSETVTLPWIGVVLFKFIELEGPIII